MSFIFYIYNLKLIHCTNNYFDLQRTASGTHGAVGVNANTDTARGTEFATHLRATANTARENTLKRKNTNIATTFGARKVTPITITKTNTRMTTIRLAIY